MSNITNTNSILIDEIVPTNDPLVVEGNTDINGDLDVSGSINANIVDPVHSVDEIEQLNNGFIQVNDDMSLDTCNLKISNINTTHTSGCQLHVQDTDDSCLFLESTGTNPDASFIVLTRDNNDDAMRISTQNSGGDQFYHFDFGGGSINNLRFNYIGSITSAGVGQLPTFGGRDPVLQLTSTEVDILKTMDLNGRNIFNVGNIALDSITSETVADIEVNDNIDMDNNDIVNVNGLTFQTTPPLDNTEDRFLVLNTADDKIEHRTLSSFNNPFDQDLNTTDDVNFNSVQINSVSGLKLPAGFVLNRSGQNNLLVHDLSTSPASVAWRSVSQLFNQDLSSSGDVDFNSVTISTGDLDMSNTGTIDRVVSLFVQNIFANQAFSTFINMRNDIDMTNNDIIDVGLLNFETTPTTDNTNSNLLTVDGSGNVEIRTVASIVSTPAMQQYSRATNLFVPITAVPGSLINSLVLDTGPETYFTIATGDTFTCQQTGLYQIEVKCKGQGASAQFDEYQICLERVNGTIDDDLWVSTGIQANTTATRTVTVTFQKYFYVNDVLQFFASLNTGSKNVKFTIQFFKLFD